METMKTDEHDRSTDADRTPRSDAAVLRERLARLRGPVDADDALAAVDAVLRERLARLRGEKAPRAKSPPLITAVEIENFKGIGRPIRIDLRPITLLFGRNSAGKSSVLHALCYAHDILSHGNVDADQTDLGGSQVDLGGFRHFVHAHDRGREIRLRFELNLEDWTVPARLWEKIQNEPIAPELAEEYGEWLETHDPATSVRSGWVQLSVARARPGAWTWRREEPVLASYEIGVNDSLAGRIVRTEAGVNLEFNWAHPLFDPLRRLPSSESRPEPSGATSLVRETPDRNTARPALRRVGVSGPSPLPDWHEPLDFDFADLATDPELGIESPTSANLPRFGALVSGVFIGIGNTLRNELARLRYIGPVRNLRPHTEVEPGGSRDGGSWSDGSAAWNLLKRHDLGPRARGDLLDDVNEWLMRADRLDTGYALLRKSTVELPEDATVGVIQIRAFAGIPAEFRNGDGDVDMDHWARKQAEKIADLSGCDPDDVEARIKDSQRDKNGLDQSDVIEDIVETNREIYKMLAEDFVAAVARIEKGSPEVKALVQAIATAPLRTTLQLVTAGTKKLQVRTSDVGVGVSQVLPVVAAALDPQRPGITAIEQPELHLHPRMQVELGDLFAQSVDQGGVFLLENHSEHLMLRLLRRIEETHGGELPEGKPALKPDQVSVIYLDRVDGEVTATRLRIGEEGEFIDRWPHGFFDERAKELF